MTLPEKDLQLDLTFQAAMLPRKIWSPRELISVVRTEVEREHGDVWVEGEISNFRPAESGHIYFTLKDDGAQLHAVMFRLQARWLRFRPENGLHVLARGRVTVYEARGELQLSVEYLEPKGAGALQVAFEQLKAKLHAEGLFDAARKKPLPALPRRIGIVTSPRGAAIQDILNILRRRHRGVHVLIYPAQVQGEAAAGEVSAGVKYFNRAKNVEIIIVTRGGGSAEDLAAWNDEGLARAIAASALPTISAVGHETDFTIADFVADLRAPTPSAAAEMVIQPQQALEENVSNLRQRLVRATRYQMMMARRALSELAQHAALSRMSDLIARRSQRLDDLRYRMARRYGAQVERYRRRLDVGEARLRHFDLRRVFAGMRSGIEAQSSALAMAMRGFIRHERSRWQEAAARLEELSPMTILNRGYALVFDAQGALIKDAGQVRPGENISARLAKGTVEATVKKASR